MIFATTALVGASLTSADHASRWTIKQNWNSVPKGDPTTEKDLAACEAKAEKHVQFAFNLHSKHCYVSDATTFGGEASDHVTSGCDASKVTAGCGAPTPTPPPAPTPPTPAPRPGGACAKDTDCSLNGVCTGSPTACSCDAAWTGPKCASFAFLPAERASGFRNINDPVMGNTSSWGGGGFYDAADKKWYMYATELAEHCGMHTWTTNSQTVRASCDTGTGLYKREAVVVPIWSHEASTTRGPAGEYVAFFSYNADEGPGRPVCHSCTDGSTDPSCKKRRLLARGAGDGTAATPPLGIENTDPTYMSWTATATGNWSVPVLVLGPKVEMDTNMAAVIKADGSLVGQWRDHYPGGKHSTPHLVTAANWKDPATYKYSKEDLLFGKSKNPGGVEDMFMWVDGRGHYHCVYHQMYSCETCTAHAFSEDGIEWTYTGTAAVALTEYTDGTKEDYGHSERPHVLFDETGTKLIALTNGVKIQGLSNDDQSFTLLRPLKQ